MIHAPWLASIARPIGWRRPEPTSADLMQSSRLIRAHLQRVLERGLARDPELTRGKE